MTRILRRPAATLALIAAVALFATPALAKKQTVTFINESDAPRYVLAVYGAGGQCEAMPEKESFLLAPGETFELDTAGKKACWCAGRRAAVSECEGWNIARPAKKVRFDH